MLNIANTESAAVEMQATAPVRIVCQNALAAPKLTQVNINIVRSALKGAKLNKLDAALNILKLSLKQGSWLPRGSVKVPAGFSSGLSAVDYQSNYSSTADKALEDDSFELMMTLRYGRPYRGKNWIGAYDHMLAKGVLKMPSSPVVQAWIELLNEVKAVSAFLSAARPRPVVTAVGLSPKVTKTLKEMNLDIDLPSIRPAKIETRYSHARGKDGTFQYHQDGSPVMEPYHVVVWTDGIVHGRSRFAHGNGCHACGKNIPSRMFVPVEATDKASGDLVSFWLGCDCAKNIFGIKDAGLAKTPA